MTTETETWRPIGDVVAEMMVDVVHMLDGIRTMQEPVAAVNADKMVMCWHTASSAERLEFAHEVASALTDPQRAAMFVACWREMSDAWRETIINAMQAELLRGAIAGGGESENV